MGNYCAWNPLDKNAGITLANVNLTAYCGSGSGYRGVRGDIPKDHGKWYFEVTIVVDGKGHVGVGNSTAPLDTYVGDDTNAWSKDLDSNTAYHSSGLGYGTAYVAGDILMVAVNLDAGKIWFGKNGTWPYLGAVGDPAINQSAAYTDADLVAWDIYPMLDLDEATQVNANFGGAPFTYTPPAGYTGWGDIDLDISGKVNFSDFMDHLSPDYNQSMAVIDSMSGYRLFYPEVPGQDFSVTADYVVGKGVLRTASGTMSFSDSITEETDIIGVQREPITFSDSFVQVMNYLNEGGSFKIPMLKISAEGYDSESGTADLTFPALTIVAEGYDSEIGNAALSIPMLRLAATADDTIIGNANLRIPRLLLNAEGYTQPEGNLNIILPMLRLSADVIQGEVGNANLTIPIIQFSALGYSSVDGNANLTIPMLKLRSEMNPDTYQNFVINIRNNALTLYDNYNFNSMCRFNGISLGATSTKIYNLNVGTKDDGAEIDWNFRLPYLNMEIKTKKHLRLAWFSYKSNGDIIVTVVQPDGTEYEYDLKGYEITEDGVRVKFGKGIKSKYLAIDVKSKDGSTIDLDTIRILMDAFKAR